MLRIGKSRTLAPALAPLARSCASRAAAAAEIAEKGAGLGIKFFQFSFVDLFGVQRSKLVPAQRVQELATNGARPRGRGGHRHRNGLPARALSHACACTHAVI